MLLRAEVDVEAVVGEADVIGELGVDDIMVELVGEVGEVGLAGFEFGDDVEGLVEAEVGRMWVKADGIEEEEV